MTIFFRQKGETVNRKRVKRLMSKIAHKKMTGYFGYNMFKYTINSYDQSCFRYAIIKFYNIGRIIGKKLNLKKNKRI